MTSPAPAPGRVLIAAGGIYTAQSLIGGLTFVSVPAILRERGVGLEQIGLVSLVMLPWAFKFLWAPWVEGLHRPRLVITIGEVLAAVLLLGVGLWGEQQAGGLLVGLAVLAVVAASVDIACDAFLISHLDKSRLGFGNVAQIGGGYLGLVFGGGLRPDGGGPAPAQPAHGALRRPGDPPRGECPASQAGGRPETSRHPDRHPADPVL